MVMTYQVTFLIGEEPDWYKKAYLKGWTERENTSINTWGQVWNDYYTCKLSLSGKGITVTFDSEQEFTAFLLRVL